MRIKNTLYKTICLASTLGIVVLTRSANAEILFYHPEIDDLNIQAELRADTTRTTYDLFLSEQLVAKDLESRLLNTYASAQKSFLAAEGTDVELRWSQVVDFAYKADWSKKQREMIQIAWLRLAQVSTRPEDVQYYLSQAAQYDPEFIPNSQIFPPPLIQHFQVIKARIGKISIPSQNFSDWTKIWVNGAPVTRKGNEFIVTQGTKRITVVSPKYLPYSTVLPSDDLLTLKPEAVPIVQGSCEKPILHETVRLKIAQETWSARYMGGCLTHKKQATARRLSDFAPESRLTSEIPVAVTPTQLDRPFYKKTQFWLGSALLVGAYIVYRNSQERDQNSDSPTTREGF